MYSPTTPPPEPSLLAARATRGPRYTSYPPATEFRDDFGEARAQQVLDDLHQAGQTRALSLYLHIPYCRSLCWYCGCNVKITRDRSRGAAYVETLLNEVRLYSQRLPGVPLRELSLGGGSPNFLAPESLRALSEGVRACFQSTEDALFGIELDPRDTSAEQIHTLASLGFGRLSVGVQDFDPHVQKTINRLQGREQTAGLIAQARQAGFASVGIDLVYGLPGQTPESFANTLAAIIEISPDRIALFGYAHLPHLRKHQRLVERQPIPGLEARAELLVRAIELLCAAGYQRVGFDHFARPEDPLARAAREKTLQRNFQGFSLPIEGPLLACGVTGISQTQAAYWQNTSDLETWRAAIEAGRLPIARGLRLTPEDELRRALINSLLCRAKIDIPGIAGAFDIDFERHFAREVRELRGPAYSGLVDMRPESISLTELGFELVRNVCMVFDPSTRGHAPRGSSTI